MPWLVANPVTFTIYSNAASSYPPLLQANRVHILGERSEDTA